MNLRLAYLVVSLGVAALGGCQSDPYCLNCSNGGKGDLAGTDGLPSDVDLAGADLAGTVDLSGVPCTLSNGGVEICDGLDNDCNGVTDDVSAAKLAADPNNCGACGNACNFTAQKQFGTCDNSTGTPTCKPGACLPGFVDTDGNPANGCDYECTQTNGGVEICDGLDNDCDKGVDEDTDKQNDAMNCGGCGIICPFIAADSTGVCSGGMCGMPACLPGHKNLDGLPNNGCEYQCPVFPTMAEVCDGIDQDCDGQKDNGATDVGMACYNACGVVAACVATNSCSYPLSANTGGTCYGQCTPGITVCSGGAAVCQAGVRPALEQCDGIDNNCDGQIDEGFNKQTDPLNCNTCGNKCEATTNKASVLAYKCVAGGCQIAACQPGFRDRNGVFADGCEHTCEVYPTTVETCNGKDDDCDGLIDETQTEENAQPAGPGKSASFVAPPTNACRQTAICAGAAPVCCGAAGFLCDYPAVNAGIEIQEASPLACKQLPSGNARAGGTLVFVETKCDNLDGDCRNGADDSFPKKALAQACAVGNGKCAGTATYVCGQVNSGTGDGRCLTAGGDLTHSTVCCPSAPVPGNATAEECNGVDDNCDGQVDERVVSATGGPYLSAYTDRFVKVRNAPNELWVYAYEASRTDGTNLVAGNASSARACSKPGVLPWANVTRAEAEAACAKITLPLGGTAHLCDQNDWEFACEGPAGPYANSYGITITPAAPPTTYTANVCNDLSRSPGGGAVWVTGFDNGVAGKRCYMDWNGAAADGELNDLSGNLMEWTSSSVLVGATTYYKVRGGAYNSPSDGTPPDGTSCQFDFNILPEGFRNANVGFRCCATSAP